MADGCICGGGVVGWGVAASGGAREGMARRKATPLAGCDGFTLHSRYRQVFPVPFKGVG